MALLKCPDCLNDVSNAAPSCPKCGRVLAAGKVTKLVRSEFAGAGCAVQALGLLAPVGGVMLAGAIGAAFGLVALLALLLVGRQMSTFTICGRCSTKLADRSATMCPGCRGTFS
jgi:predicted amidophosphoribosyltransferase